MIPWTFYVWVLAVAVFCVSLFVFFRGFFRFYAKKSLRDAIVVARDGNLGRAMLLVKVSLNFDSYYRRCEELHDFYRTIQSSPTSRALDEKVELVEAMIARRGVTRVEELWEKPEFRNSLVWLLILITLLRLVFASQSP